MTRTTKTRRDLLAVTITVHQASTYLQLYAAGAIITTEGAREMMVQDISAQAWLNGVPGKHVSDMQKTAGEFFDRHFAPLYALYFKPKGEHPNE